MSRAANDINMRFTLEQFFAFAIGHAANNSDNNGRVILFQATQLTQQTMHSLFSIFTHGTSVEHMQLRFLGVLGFYPTPLNECRTNQFAVIEIHLTAKNSEVKATGH